MDKHTDLCLRFLMGEASEQEVAALNAWIAESPDHAERFALLAAQEASMSATVANVCAPAGASHDVLAELASLEASAGEAQPVDLTDELKRRGLAAKRKARREAMRSRQQAAQARPGNEPIVVPRPLVWLGLAAVIGLVATLAVYFDRSGPTATPPPGAEQTQPGPTAPPERVADPAPVLATLVRSLDARWAGDAGAWDGGRGLRRGGHTLAEGLAEIELASGTRVVLEAPVSFELVGSNVMGLANGRLVAYVPPSGYGFTVETPTARIVDYGTEFGVEADGDRATRVQVFEGEVRAAARVEGVVRGEPVPVLAEQAATIDAGGASVARAAYDPQRFEREVTRRLDLADLVMGGDGTGGLSEIGIHPLTGALTRSVGTEPDVMIMLSTGEARPVPASACVSRIFVLGTEGVIAGLPDGLDLPGLPTTNGVGFGLLWSGTQLPTPTPNPPTPVTNNIPGYDLDRPGHQSLIMHANVGLVIDLDAIRQANPGMRVKAVVAVVGNTAGRNPVDPAAPLRAEFLVYLDNGVAAHQRFNSTDPLDNHSAELSIDVDDRQRYLTLISADAGDQNHRDWLVVGDPVVVLEPIP